MNFRTIFDLSVSGYRDWEFPAVVGAIVLCVTILNFVRVPWGKAHAKDLGNIAVGAIVLCFIARQLISTYLDYRDIVTEVYNGNTTEYVGSIERISQTGISHGTLEEISVNGHVFSFRSNSPNSDFHEIGLLHKGEIVRVTAAGERLVKVEVDNNN